VSRRCTLVLVSAAAFAMGAHQIVSAGTQVASESCMMIFTKGQPTKLPTTHTSENHRMRGRLGGANGSPP
jgi:hypothetical protein